MRKNALSDRDLQIGHRLREARERCDLSQMGCARQLGIERSTLLNYEHHRTPLRFDTALRFCRQFIVSEEWLATGRHDACHAVALKLGIPPGPGAEKMDAGIYFHQCVDLLSEPATIHIPPGTLFSEAYDRFLAPEYARLVDEFFYLPRIVVSDSDNPELAVNLLRTINTRFLMMLINKALERGQKGSSAWRVYARCLLESADLVFRKMMRFPLDVDCLNDLAWLRDCVTNPDAFIPFLYDPPNERASVASKNDLTDTATESNIVGVKSMWPALKRRLQSATAESGKKSELAKFLKLDLTRVSQWLTDSKSAREPGAEYALQMLRWVEQQERQK